MQIVAGMLRELLRRGQHVAGAPVEKRQNSAVFSSALKIEVVERQPRTPAPLKKTQGDCALQAGLLFLFLSMQPCTRKRRNATCCGRCCGDGPPRARPVPPPFTEIIKLHLHKVAQTPTPRFTT